MQTGAAKGYIDVLRGEAPAQITEGQHTAMENEWRKTFETRAFNVAAESRRNAYAFGEARREAYELADAELQRELAAIKELAEAEQQREQQRELAEIEARKLAETDNREEAKTEEREAHDNIIRKPVAQYVSSAMVFETPPSGMRRPHHTMDEESVRKMHKNPRRYLAAMAKRANSIKPLAIIESASSSFTFIGSQPRQPTTSFKKASSPSHEKKVSLAKELDCKFVPECVIPTASKRQVKPVERLSEEPIKSNAKKKRPLLGVRSLASPVSDDPLEEPIRDSSKKKRGPSTAHVVVSDDALEAARCVESAKRAVIGAKNRTIDSLRAAVDALKMALEREHADREQANQREQELRAEIRELKAALKEAAPLN